MKDTVNDAAALNVSVLGKVELDKLPKATGVIVVHGLSIPKGFHDGTADRKSNQANQLLIQVQILTKHDNTNNIKDKPTTKYTAKRQRFLIHESNNLNTLTYAKHPEHFKNVKGTR